MNPLLTACERRGFRCAFNGEKSPRRFLPTVNPSSDLPLGVGGRAKTALAELARDLRKDLAVRPALRLQRQVAPTDEVVDGFVEEGEHLADDPGGFGRAQSTRADGLRDQLAPLRPIR